jgi:ATP-binding cassette subfamily C (CFTR/MRP) protein 1
MDGCELTLEMCKLKYELTRHRVDELTGMNLRAAIVLIVYRKSLTLSSATRQQSNTGTIVNLMSTDSTRLQDVTTYLAVLWSAPMQIVLSLYFLWEQIGPATLAGLAVMIVSIPINGYTARRLRVYSKQVRYTFVTRLLLIGCRTLHLCNKTTLF